MTETPSSAAEFEHQLREPGRAYHIHHPFNVMLNSGKATPAQIRGWVANRFYYQISIPRKDAAILANCDEPAVSRAWVQRILDQDGHGHGHDSGGIEAWLRLAEAVGLQRLEVEGLALLLPGYASPSMPTSTSRRAPWLEGVCASLSELFAPEIHRQRLATWPEHYPWIERAGLTYFQSRASGARRDVEHGLALMLERCRTAAAQECALEVLEFKVDVLWQMNDAMALAYGVAQ